MNSSGAKTCIVILAKDESIVTITDRNRTIQAHADYSLFKK